MIEAATVTTVRKTATAAPNPYWLLWKVSLNIVSASVSDAPPGPPLVMPQTMSKVLSEPTMLSPTTTVVSGVSIGHVMVRNSVKPEAPSTRAASSGSFGIDCRPMPNSSALTPAPCQVEATIMTKVFSGESSSQRGASTPKNPTTWLSAPLVCRMNDQMTPTATPEIAYGMRNGSRNSVAFGSPWLSTAIISPRPTGRISVPATQ